MQKRGTERLTLEESIWIFYDLKFGIVYDCLEFISPTPVQDNVGQEEEEEEVLFSYVVI